MRVGRPFSRYRREKEACVTDKPLHFARIYLRRNSRRHGEKKQNVLAYILSPFVVKSTSSVEWIDDWRFSSLLFSSQGVTRCRIQKNGISWMALLETVIFPREDRARQTANIIWQRDFIFNSNERSDEKHGHWCFSWNDTVAFTQA